MPQKGQTRYENMDHGCQRSCIRLGGTLWRDREQMSSERLLVATKQEKSVRVTMVMGCSHHLHHCINGVACRTTAAGAQFPKDWRRIKVIRTSCKT